MSSTSRTALLQPEMSAEVFYSIRKEERKSAAVGMGRALNARMDH
jgi:hypothetical protein